MWNLPKIKFRKDSKKDRKNYGMCFKGNPSKQNNRTVRAFLWKGLSLCRRVQNQRIMRKGWMLKAVCDLP